MAILVNCSGCGRKFRAKDHIRNSRIKCPACKADVTVQGPHVCGTDVFISHSATDKSIADAACQALESKNVKCWISPRNIPPGASWGSSIIEGIEDSRAMLLVFSERANRSDQVMREIERAVAKGKPIVPLRIDGSAMRKDFEYFLASCHWLDATDGNLPGHLESLTRTMRQMLLDRVDEESSSSPLVPAVVLKGRKRLAMIGVAFLAAAAALIVVFATRPKPASESPIAATQPAEIDKSNLLARVRIPDDVVSGTWTRGDDGLSAAASGETLARIRFGAPPAGDYDVRVEFTPLDGDDGFGVILFFRNKSFVFFMGNTGPSEYLFRIRNNRTHQPSQIKKLGSMINNVRHSALIKVRKDGLVAIVDGVQVRAIKTDYSEMSISPQWAIGRGSLGIVTHRSAIIHSAQCIPVSEGRGDSFEDDNGE